MSDFSTLLALAEQIRTNTAAASNTAELVGSAIKGIVQALQAHNNEISTIITNGTTSLQTLIGNGTTSIQALINEAEQYAPQTVEFTTNALRQLTTTGVYLATDTITAEDGETESTVMRGVVENALTPENDGIYQTFRGFYIPNTQGTALEDDAAPHTCYRTYSFESHSWSSWQLVS